MPNMPPKTIDANIAINSLIIYALNIVIVNSAYVIYRYVGSLLILHKSSNDNILEVEVAFEDWESGEGLRCTTPVTLQSVMIVKKLSKPHLAALPGEVRDRCPDVSFFPGERNVVESVETSQSARM